MFLNNRISGIFYRFFVKHFLPKCRDFRERYLPRKPPVTFWQQIDWKSQNSTWYHGYHDKITRKIIANENKNFRPKSVSNQPPSRPFVPDNTVQIVLKRWNSICPSSQLCGNYDRSLELFLTEPRQQKHLYASCNSYCAVLWEHGWILCPSARFLFPSICNLFLPLHHRLFQKTFPLVNVICILLEKPHYNVCHTLPFHYRSRNEVIASKIICWTPFRPGRPSSLSFCPERKDLNFVWFCMQASMQGFTKWMFNV